MWIGIPSGGITVQIKAAIRSPWTGYDNACVVNSDGSVYRNLSVELDVCGRRISQRKMQKFTLRTSAAAMCIMCTQVVTSTVGVSVVPTGGALRVVEMIIILHAM